MTTCTFVPDVVLTSSNVISVFASNVTFFLARIVLGSPAAVTQMVKVPGVNGAYVGVRQITDEKGIVRVLVASVA